MRVFYLLLNITLKYADIFIIVHKAVKGCKSRNLNPVFGFGIHTYINGNLWGTGISELALILPNFIINPVSTNQSTLQLPY